MEKDAGVLSLIFFEDIGLHCAAYIGEDDGLNFFVFGRIRSSVVVGDEFFHLLVNSGVHEHCQDDRCRTVDGHGYRGGRGTEIKTAVEKLDVIKGADTDAGCTDLAIDIRTYRRIPAIKGDGIKGRGEPFCRVILREKPEPFIGLCRTAFSGKHAGRVLTGALHREDATGIGEVAR